MNLKSLCLIVTLATVGCIQESSKTTDTTPVSTPTIDANAEPNTVMQVSGMSCSGCESKIVKKLQALDGIAAAKANAESGRVEVHFASGKTCSQEALTKAIADAGEQFTVDSIE